MALRTIVDKLTLQELGARLRQFQATSAQQQLLATINTTLVLMGDELVNCANGEARRLAASDTATAAEAIAHVARSLLSGTTELPHVLLLLPPSQFAATRFSLGLQGEHLLRSALSLQAPMLLPAYDQPLLLAVSGQRGEGVALWFPEDQANRLYRAFEAEGLQLVGLQPRVLAAAAMSGASAAVLDEDDEQITVAELRDGSLKSWHAVQRRDLQEPAFAAQWEAELGLLKPAPQPLSPDYWRSLRSKQPALGAYSLVPAGAIARGKHLVARRARKRMAAAAVLLLGLMVLPFVSNFVRIALLEREVLALQEDSAAARSSQAAVYELEDFWGPVADYPQQDVAALLLALDTLINDSLSSFTLNKGVVDISGFAADPALLIEQLSEQELFYNVGQSRGTSGGGDANRGDRFGIRMNVSGIDFPAYESRHKSTQN